MKRVIAVVAVLASFSVFAQMEKPKKPAVPTQNHNFGERDINGERQIPTDELVTPPPTFVFKNLIKVRSSFQPELAKSVDELK